MKKEPAQLTVEEERAREKAMDFYRYIGKTDVEATRLAWYARARIGGLLKISSNARAGTEVFLSIPSGIAFQSSATDQETYK